MQAAINPIIKENKTCSFGKKILKNIIYFMAVEFRKKIKRSKKS